MATQPEITAIYELGTNLIKEHGLYEKGWRFNLGNMKRLVGRCEYKTKQIKFSVHYLLKSSQREIRNVILHEIAHALVGPGHHHDYVWRRQARAIGCTAMRCASPEAVSTATPNYIIKCTRCGKEYPRYRLKRKLTNGSYRSTCCSAELEFFKVAKNAS
jgi:predicted SprT family Zn-dependent metalloprotease